MVCDFGTGSVNGYAMMGGGFYLNWIIGALIFSFIFWGLYYLLIKNKNINADLLKKTKINNHKKYDDKRKKRK